MTKTCIICKKQPIPGDFTRSFHKFPANNVLRQKWIEAIGISKITKVSTVCSDHFKHDSFHNTDGYTETRRLLSTAVPILNKTCTVLKETSNSCTMEMNECFSCIAKSDVLQKEGSEMTTNNKNSMTSKRKRSITNAEIDISNKKFYFMDGYQRSHISREDFVSDEAWRRFIKLMKYNNSLKSRARKRSWRRGKLSSNFKEIIKSLRDKNASSAVEYLEVVL